MQHFRPMEHDVALVGWGVRVMLLTAAESVTGRTTANRIAGFGGLVETQTEMFAALEALIDDPQGYGLFIIDCDGLGGIEVGRKAFSMLGEQTCRLPVILTSRECAEQMFPDDRNAPIMLRAPVSARSMRIGFDHALRERISFRAA